MFFWLLLLLWNDRTKLSALSSADFPDDQNGPDCLVNNRNPEPVRKAATKAKGMIQESKEPIGNRLLIMILFSRGFSAKANNNRLEFLRCALLKLQQQLMTKTPADVFIWGLNSTEDPIMIPSWFNSVTFPRTHIIELPSEVWKIPCGLVSEKEWVTRRHFDIDYYLMGRWRLTFSFDFAKEMGYEYHLQFDDDAMLNSPVPYNIISEFQTKQYSMGVFSDLIGEVPHVTLGLPELTNYWLKIHKFTPRGLIQRHLKGQTLQAFNSDTWDRMYHPGYFLIVKISFWFSKEVQDYLMTILRSGRDIEGRWQEQAVINMIRLIFVPEKELWIMNEVDIGHDRHKRSNFENWCVRTGVMRIK